MQRDFNYLDSRCYKFLILIIRYYRSNGKKFAQVGSLTHSNKLKLNKFSLMRNKINYSVVSGFFASTLQSSSSESHARPCFLRRIRFFKINFARHPCVVAQYINLFWEQNMCFSLGSFAFCLCFLSDIRWLQRLRHVLYVWFDYPLICYSIVSFHCILSLKNL